MLFLFTQIIVTHVSFITLKTFDNPIDAHLLKTKLESEGIVVYLFDENINSINPLYNIATGGIKLNIAEQDLDRAVEVLREIDAAAYVDEYCCVQRVARPICTTIIDRCVERRASFRRLFRCFCLFFRSTTSCCTNAKVAERSFDLPADTIMALTIF